MFNLKGTDRDECLGRLVTRLQKLAVNKHNSGDEKTAGILGQAYFALKTGNIHTQDTETHNHVLETLVSSNRVPVEVRNDAEYVLASDPNHVIRMRDIIPRPTFSPGRVALASLLLLVAPAIKMISFESNSADCLPTQQSRNTSKTPSDSTKCLDCIVSEVPVDNNYISGRFIIDAANILITDLKGFRSYYNKKLKKRIKGEHDGVDISCKIGTPVYAMQDGTISFIGIKSGYGRVVEIDHGNGYTSIVAHGSNFIKKLSEGMKVEKGTVIMYSGKSGNADGPTVHFEIRKNGEPLDLFNDDRVVFDTDIKNNIVLKDCIRREQPSSYKLFMQSKNDQQEIIDSKADQQQKYKEYVLYCQSRR